MTQRNNRLLQGAVFVLCLGAFLGSLYFQYVIGLHPCSLCLMQRVCVFLLALFAAIHLVTERIQVAFKLLGGQFIIAASGLFFALRQLWLQSFAAEHAACLPGLDVLIQYFPWQDVARALFWGSAGCSEVVWSGLGLSMAAWSALCFVGVIGLIITHFAVLRREIGSDVL